MNRRGFFARAIGGLVMGLGLWRFGRAPQDGHCYIKLGDNRPWRPMHFRGGERYFDGRICHECIESKFPWVPA